jgi:hypothetical protein
MCYIFTSEEERHARNQQDPEDRLQDIVHSHPMLENETQKKKSSE